MVGGTASDKDDAAAPSDGANVLAQSTKSNLLVGDIQTTTHRVDNRLWLLENLLLHKVVELALHDFLKFQLQSLDGADGGGAITLASTVNVELSLVNVGDIIVLKIENLLGVLDDGRRVGTQEELGRHGHAIVRKESPRLRAMEKALVGRGQAVVSADLKILESHIVGGLLRRQRARIRILDINKVHLHLARCLDTNDKRRALAGGNDLVGIVDRLQKQTKSSLKLGDHGLCQGSHVDI